MPFYRAMMHPQVRTPATFFDAVDDRVAWAKLNEVVARHVGRAGCDVWILEKMLLPREVISPGAMDRPETRDLLLWTPVRVGISGEEWP